MRDARAPGSPQAPNIARVESTATLVPSSGPPAPLAARIRISNAPAKPSTFHLRGGPCRVGAGEGVDVLIDDTTVSRVHAQLELVREGVLVTDLGSRNGTFLYGQRIERAILGLGSKLSFGRVEAEILADLSSELLPPSSERSYGALRGTSEAMRRLFSLLARLEGSLVNVLVSGETGTGKELVARALHERSHVADGPFVSVNCGALDRSLSRSELFGHARGAFTGASEARAGAFEAASGGTLFLDEIGELPVEVQPLLLRALEQGVIVRVGETQERAVKVRLIAATHRDLAELVKQNLFREDLYYRLMVVKVAVPPLRERLEDVPLLIQHFAEELGMPPLPADTVAELQRGGYPGNVRELRNVIQAYSAVGTLPEGTVPTAPELASRLKPFVRLDRPYAEQKQQLMNAFLDVYLEQLLAHTSGNQTEAARLSGLERSYLNRVVNRRRRE
jgi:DNA-binding NtrC family response regulator